MEVRSISFSVEVDDQYLIIISFNSGEIRIPLSRNMITPQILRYFLIALENGQYYSLSNGILTRSSRVVFNEVCSLSENSCRPIFEHLLREIE